MSQLKFQVKEVGKINYIHPLSNTTSMNIVSRYTSLSQTPHASIKIPGQIVIIANNHSDAYIVGTVL